MLDKKTLAKMAGFAVVAILLTAFNVGIVIYCRPSPLLSFIIGGITFSTWFSLIELVVFYLEERRNEKFR